MESEWKRPALVVLPELCTGCRLCELACTIHKKGDFSPGWGLLETGRSPDLTKCFALTCFQCGNAPCKDVCPRQAITVSTKTGALVVDRWGCNGCGLCVTACPFGMIQMGQKGPAVIKCDFCAGSPDCVKVCPTGALRYVSRREIRDVLLSTC